MHESNAQECLHKITAALLGDNFYIESPMGGNQANDYITEIICEQFKTRTRKEKANEFIKSLIGKRG